MSSPNKFFFFNVSAQVMAQFPVGFNANNLPGFPSANFGNFRPQYSVPGQQTQQQQQQQQAAAAAAAVVAANSGISVTLGPSKPKK